MNAIIMNLSVYYVTKALKCKRLFQVSMQYKFRSLKLCNNDEQESFFFVETNCNFGRQKHEISLFLHLSGRQPPYRKFCKVMTSFVQRSKVTVIQRSRFLLKGKGKNRLMCDSTL